MQNQYILFSQWRKLAAMGCMAFFCCVAVPGFSQTQTVTTVQGLGFGAFVQGSSGGTVTVPSQEGERSTSGSVILLNLGQVFGPALFDVTTPYGTSFTISTPANVTLSGSNGGTMSLQLANPYPGSTVSADPSGTTRVSLGGTLTVGNSAASPPGAYSGAFNINITFHTE